MSASKVAKAIGTINDNAVAMEASTGLVDYNPLPQTAPGAAAAEGHNVDNSIPLSIFPVHLDKFAICFCGMPARGKTHIARRLARYLEFFHAMPVSLYTLSEYRRRLFGAVPDTKWFDDTDREGNEVRSACLAAAVKDCLSFLHENDSSIAIFDSSSATHKRRIDLVNKIRTTGAKILWIEVTNEDDDFLLKQCHQTAISSPDFKGICTPDAIRNYRKRIDMYKAFYEELNAPGSYYSPIETRWSYIKADHAKQDFVIHNVKGHLLQKVTNFIMNLRTTAHAFYFSRHGQSEYNNLGRIGGDSGLSNHGLAYAKKLAEFVETDIVRDSEGNEVPARLWTSSMRRTKETAQFINHRKIIVKPDPSDPSQDYEWLQMRPRAWHHLDELFAGACDGMTYEEIEQQFPEEWERRKSDKLAYRYPRGESYFDVIARLEPIIIEMERHQEPLLIVAHQGILRIIYAFYMGLSRAEAPYVSIKLNCVTELIPAVYGCVEKVHVLYKPEKCLAYDGQNEDHGDASASGRKEKETAAEKDARQRSDDPPSH
mmetsp:Transcript_24660/g.41145  ORF Transcript_24660/g.41145 Transcript_24660/m.41145 type:complete len:542 (-) Transcript_24660:1051-2676(-)